MTKYEGLIELFGSASALARAAGVERTLPKKRWFFKGSVPTQYNARIIAAAREQGMDLHVVSSFLNAHVCHACGAELEPGTTTPVGKQGW